MKKPLSFQTIVMTRFAMGDRLRRSLEGYAIASIASNNAMLAYWHNEIRQILDARYELEQVFEPSYEAAGAIECPF